LDSSNEYTFTEKERAFFAAQIEELNRRVLAVNTAAGLVAAQNGLEGQWMVKPDGSGLMKDPREPGPANV
jgi:hypothetical protein